MLMIARLLHAGLCCQSVLDKPVTNRCAFVRQGHKQIFGLFQASGFHRPLVCLMSPICHNNLDIMVFNVSTFSYRYGYCHGVKISATGFFCFDVTEVVYANDE